MNNYIGKKLDGRYEIKELIGIGGMADVYKAYDIAENKQVAVKILKDEYLTNEDFKRRFRNESKAIAVLSHPNIVKIFDVSFGDRIQFIVMEYVDGITLKEYIDQQGVVNWKEAVHFTVQILRALQHAHDNGIVHRDIKPQNVMLLQDGTVKVMDFGIARFARDNGRTLSEKAIGSVHYISPEQAKGEVTDEKTDIYSVGVLMFEMLTGKLPFDGETPVAVAIKQMHSEAERPRSINPDIPEGLEEIIIRAMKKDPDFRYQSAAEMLKDIDEFKRNPSVVFEYKYLTDDTSTKYFDTVSDESKEEEEEPKKKMSTVMQVLIGVASACIILAIIVTIIFFRGIGNSGDEYPNPNLVGQLYDDVIANDNYAYIKIKVDGTEMSDEYEEGYIISQTPAANTKIKKGQTVKVIVSEGLNAYEVDDVVGMDQSKAVKKLEKSGFGTNIIEKYDSSVAEGKVIKTDPEAGSLCKKGDIINIYVSKGAASVPVKVPNLVGMTASSAEATLKELGLGCSITTVESSKKKDEVISQSYDYNETVEKGTVVALTVSSGANKNTSVTVELEANSSYEDKNVELKVYLASELVSTKTVNLHSNKFSYTATGTGQQALVVKIGNDTLASFQIDFAKGTSTRTKLNSDLLMKKETASDSPSLSSSEPTSSDVSSATEPDTSTGDTGEVTE